MRNAFALEMTARAAHDARVFLLTGDIGNRLFDGYKELFPDRFLNCGVAEANMTSVAAGMALSGLRPTTYTIAPFNTIRCLEQIKIDVCYHGLPVTVVGVGGGLAYASLGATHHSLDDVAVMRTLPGMTVLCPCDAVETRLATRAALELDGPCYLRLGKKGEPLVHPTGYDFRIGRWPDLRRGGDLCLIASGTLVGTALAAADLLAAKGVEVRVVNAHTVKPLDGRALAAAFAETDLVCVLEEHSLVGGLGSAVGEWLADAGTRAGSDGAARLLRLGAPDAFLHAVGGQNQARARLGLNAPGVAGAALKALEAKRQSGAASCA